MLYRLLKCYARVALYLYCTRVRINRPQLLHHRGPLLLAANHPNSFLDGILLTTLFHNHLYSLARGDAFKGTAMNRFLRSMKLLPVYRTSEGVENLEHNYTTFASCVEAFREGSAVLIFSEGRCENEWHLRPLKKGTARLAFSAWQQGIPLTVVPLAFNYSSFKSFGKEVHLQFGEPIEPGLIDRSAAEGKQLLQFNALLQERLQPMVYEIGAKTEAAYTRYFQARPTFVTWLLLPLAALGMLLHGPLSLPVHLFARIRFRNSGHYDSVQTALLLLAYPLYLLLLFFLAANLSWWHAAGVLLLSPLSVRAAVQVKVDIWG